MGVKIVEWPGKRDDRAVTAFLRRPAFDAQAEAVAAEVLADIRKHGNRAVVKCAKQFDGVALKSGEFLVTRAEVRRARESVTPATRKALQESHKRVRAFARAGMRKDWHMPTPRGGTLGEQFVPLDRVGVYVPGGKAPLVSTVLMTVTLAKVAGVSEIVACTPCGPDQRVDPALLFALDLAGASEIYRVGGIQAIGLMAFGTRTVRKVDKIVGPGGPYVTAAKRQVYGYVGLDLVAGPSEIAVLADRTADPRHVAVDLLSQAEHGTGWEKALLVTTSAGLARAVRDELDVQAASLSRETAIRQVMKNGMLLVVVRGLSDGMKLCNAFAPEHLEIMVREPRRWLREVKRAGAVFVGKWSPESAGDFVAGPSHVLPTGGSAAMFSGLTVEDFRRRTSVIAFTRADLKDTLPTIEAFGAIEGLDAHARSAAIRLEQT